ncbi:sigma-70 family RNA polymerase sigma factor [Pseudomonas sp. BJa3]|uniref:sigma-70 family RNA polymerase sigma factor n=1 Tax=Pseudomonas sp. BJa3 TaxID=2986525 RepID=UPI0022659442|nr:sigma-70 family RNA polymerase sigma factor [Pseudomonas sp. BJa3]MCX5509672.1 sigma-70 family RNA polymerase sigma factor [Pseudomonas sp. BJa3]
MASIDTAQLTALYEQQHRWLRSWLYRQLSCSHRAADLMQDTFMRLLASNEALEIRQPRPFLAKVARSVLSNHYRRARLEKAYLEALQTEDQSELPDLATQLILFETLVRLDEALCELDVAVKKAFLWSQLDGLGHAEIAERLDISIATVKRHIIKAGARCMLVTEWLQ